jgi:hypothetical protein
VQFYEHGRLRRPSEWRLLSDLSEITGITVIVYLIVEEARLKRRMILPDLRDAQSGLRPFEARRFAPRASGSRDMS